MLINKESPSPPTGLFRLGLLSLTSSSTEWEILFLMKTNMMLDRIQNWMSYSSELANHLRSKFALTASMLSVPGGLKMLNYHLRCFHLLSSNQHLCSDSQCALRTWFHVWNRMCVFSASGKSAVAFWYNLLPSEVDRSMVSWNRLTKLLVIGEVVVSWIRSFP